MTAIKEMTLVSESVDILCTLSADISVCALGVVSAFPLRKYLVNILTRPNYIAHQCETPCSEK